MGLLIDTSVFVALERRRGEDLGFDPAIVQQESYLSAVTASELLHGVHRARTAAQRARRERFVETILGALPVLPVDLVVARTHARLWADLAMRGVAIGAHDLWIAATALAHDLGVLTANRREFERIEDLEIVVPVI